MNIKITNAALLDVRNGTLKDNCCIIIKDDIISKISFNDTYGENFDRVIDFKGDILMPSFVNAHAHSAMTLFRGIADDLPLQEWLFDNIIPLESKLEEEDIYNGVMLAIAEYVQGGITTFCDMYFMQDAIYRANQRAGTYCICVGGTSDLDQNYEEAAQIEEERFLKYHGKLENADYMLGCHAEYTCSEKFLNLMTDLSYKYKTQIYTHACETLLEVGECTIRHNDLTPIQYFHKIGFFDNGAVLAHCVHLDKDDIKIMSQCNDVHVVHNPASNLKLASGIAPVCSMVKNGINVALGTDGASSNNNLDMFKEMYLAANLQKSLMYDAKAIKAHDAIKMATVNGALALRLKNRGEILEGYKADLIRIDVNSVHMHPHNNLVDNIVYAAKSSDVKLTMCNGKILYENGNFYIGDSIDNIIKNSAKSIKKLTKQLK